MPPAPKRCSPMDLTVVSCGAEAMARADDGGVHAPMPTSEPSTTTTSTRHLLSVLFLLLNDGHESLHVLNLLAQPCMHVHSQVSAAAMHPPQYLKVYYLRRARRPCQPNPAMHRVLWRHVYCSISRAQKYDLNTMLWKFKYTFQLIKSQAHPPRR